MASRRAADALIASGTVRVNGHVPPPTGTLVEAGVDRVTVAGRRVVPAEGSQYLALHKPAGVVVTARDPAGRPTVFDLVKEATPPTGTSSGRHRTAGPRLFAVGRLDAATTGLLLLTGDGELAHRLAHPRFKVPKEYVALVAGVPGERDLRALRQGVLLEDGPTLPAEVELLGGARGLSRVRLVIREGRNRQVRRMLDAVGHPARELTRTAFGPVRLGHLRPGDWRRLRPNELASLREAVAS